MTNENHISYQSHKNLRLACLTRDMHEKTCGYWYTVTADGCTPHTALRNENALWQWLEQRGLKIDGEIPERGEHASFAIIGEYNTAMHMNQNTFYAERGFTTRDMSNGEWTLAILENETGEIVTVHTLNPNAPRHTFDYRASQLLQDQGEL